MQLKDKLHRVPSSIEFAAEYGSGFLGSVKLTFGTWGEALKILNMTARTGGTHQYTNIELLELLSNFYKQKHREPISSDHAGLLPSRQTYTKHFGSYTEAKRLAGVLGDKIGLQRHYRTQTAQVR